VRLYSQAHIWGIVCASRVPGTLQVTKAWCIYGPKPVFNQICKNIRVAFISLCIYLFTVCFLIKRWSYSKLKYSLSPFVGIFISLPKKIASTACRLLPQNSSNYLFRFNLFNNKTSGKDWEND
jgi:hypothetical protein